MSNNEIVCNLLKCQQDMEIAIRNTQDSWRDDVGSRILNNFESELNATGFTESCYNLGSVLDEFDNNINELNGMLNEGAPSICPPDDSGFDIPQNERVHVMPQNEVQPAIRPQVEPQQKVRPATKPRTERQSDDSSDRTTSPRVAPRRKSSERKQENKTQGGSESKTPPKRGIPAWWLNQQKGRGR